MKRNTIIIFLISLGLVNISQASVVISHYGVYKTKEITFIVDFATGNSTPRMENGRIRMHFFNDLTFEIKANSGYKLYNETNFKYKGRLYYFQAREIKNYFYVQAERKFKHGLKKVTYITLTYQIRIRPESRTIFTKTFVKKLKVTKPDARSKRGNVLKIEEVPN